MANSFKTWVDSPSAGQQVQSATIFAADTQRKDGFKAGDPASSLRINSALRQANLVCASFMQFCDNNAALSVDLSLMSSIAQVTSAIQAVFTKLHTDTLNSSKTYTNTRETEINKSITGVQSQVTGNTNDIISLKTRMTNNEQEIAGLSGSSSTLTTRVATLETDNTSNKNDIISLKTRMTNVETSLNDIKASIANINTPYTQNVQSSDWTGSTGNYSLQIPVTKHNRGTRPRVHTYVQNGSLWEETYDSPAINITTGDVTIYSNTNIALFLVIY